MATSAGKIEGVQVVEVEGSKYNLDVPQLEKILKNDKVKDLPVVVVSVAGAYRGGKSFLLNFFLKYIKASVQSQADGSWIGDDVTPLEGFSWRGGSKRNTTGIVMWSEPITTKLFSGEEVAVILMDTQGTFDSESTVRDSSTIFALSTLLSSIQIYNIAQQIREDDLQHLQLFTEYGTLIKDSSEDKAFQVLEFLVRDWANAATDYPYGSAGGKLYLEEKLQTKPGQPFELKDLRNHIRASFTSVSCFLLPHPGLAVIEPDFIGKNQDLTAKFKTYVKELASYLFGPGMLKPKMINGQTVKTAELFTYFKTYVDIFNSDTIPTPTTIMQATAEAGRLSAFEEARSLYEKDMDRDCGPGKPSVPAHDLKDLHEMHAANAIAVFSNKKKMGSKDETSKYLNKLKEELNKRLPQFADINFGKIQKVMIEAKEAYDAQIGQIRADQLLCVHPLDLTQVHEGALRAAVTLFDKNRRLISKKEDKERAEFKRGFQKQYDYLWLVNEQNNKMAVNELRLEYWMTMESKCSGENPLSESEFCEAHKEALKAALEGFAKRRNHPDTHDEDNHKSNLIEVINNRSDQIRVINKSKNKAALQAGIRAYVEYMESAWNANLVCLHPGDLDEEHTEGERRALSAFRPNRVSSGKVFFDTTDADEKILCEVLHQRFKEIEELNDSANETAVQGALNLYNSEMEYNCGFSITWILTIGISYVWNKSKRNDYHNQSKSKAYKFLYDQRRESSSTATDRFYDDLESKISAARKKY